MNLNLKKSMLLVGALASLGLSYTTEAYATSPNQAECGAAVEESDW